VSTCPCGLPLPYPQCCGRYHAGPATAPTAEALMRSRFTAFALGDADYLRRSWHPSTRPRRLDLDPELAWTRLEIIGSTGGSLLHTEGTVEFRAHHTGPDGPGVLHEHSRFRREPVWLYLDALAD
jgi:SEC-C motif-containing protein